MYSKQLAEHIDFQEAKTIDEAIEFGKKHLGVKSYKGFEEKVKHLYTILNRPDTSFVDNMDAILNYGNEIFNSEAALICHLSGEDKEDILVNYVTDNKIKLEQNQEFKVGNCLADILEGKIQAAWASRGFLFTHAGCSDALFKVLKKDLPSKGKNNGWKISPIEVWECLVSGLIMILI